MSEHQYMADFQPIGSKVLLGQIFMVVPLNYAALFAAAYVMGKGLKMGLGL